MQWNELTFEKLTRENLKALQNFAREAYSRPHVIPDDILENPSREIRIISRKGVWIGYYEKVLTPVYYPAISDRCKPRDLCEILTKLVGASMEQYEEGFVGVTHNDPNFQEHIMNKLGFGRTHMEVYHAPGNH